MSDSQQPPRLKPPPPLQPEQESGLLKLVGKVSRQRWLTVGAIVFLGGAGLLMADAAAEVIVGRLQRGEDDDDVG